MSAETQVVVRCVRASTDTQQTSVIEEAYEVIKEIGADSVWFSEEDCETVQTKESRYIYLFERFTGAAFLHICSTGNRIYGPVCVLHCMKKGKALPKEKHPVYNMAMSGMRISCTSVAKDQRDVVHQHVEWMSGQICKDFHQDVTHLVAGEVGSKKYLVAVKLHKKVMSPEWVEQVWNASQSSFVRGDDPTFEQFRCPIFKGYVVTVSGLDSNERGQIKEIIHKEGGRYSGEMKKEECTHLVINTPRGQKYEVAMQWGIHVVTSKWLFESLEAGYCLEEAAFPVHATDNTAQDRKNHATSTPTRNRQSTYNMSDMPDVSVISMTHVNDTNMTMMQNSTMASVRNQTISQVNKSVVSGNQTLTTNDVTQDVLADLDLTTTAASEMFLDGCKIFLSGFKGAQLEKLRKIINLGGGTRFNQINESVSHVVIGERVDSHIEQLQTAAFRPHVVSVEWLVACVQSAECVDEEPYICLNLSPLEPTTPKPKSRKSSLNASKISSRQSGSMSDSTLTKAIPESTAVSVPQPSGDKEDMNDLLSQYLPEDTSKDTMGESTLMRAAEMGEVANRQAAPSTPANRQAAPSTPANRQAAPSTPVNRQAASSTPASRQAAPSTPANDCREADSKQPQGDMDATVDPNATADPESADGLSALFQGVTFVFQGFEPIAVQEMTTFIKQSGGKVVQSNTRRVPDYAIVPLFGYPVDVTVGDIVTNAWLQICLEQCQILPVNADPIYTPLDLAPGAPSLTSCVLSVSGYTGTERDCIIHMAQILGATVQDYFVKRANAAKQLQENTHLVVDVAEGSKYAAAIKWKIPAVTKNWLIECARLNKRVGEDMFLVGREHSPSTRSIVESPAPCKGSPGNQGQGHSNSDQGHSSKNQTGTDHAKEMTNSAKSRKRSDVVAMETETAGAIDDISHNERTLQQQMDNNENEAEEEVEPPRQTPEYRESQKENRRQASVSGTSNGSNAANKSGGSNTRLKKDALEQKPYLLNTPKLVNHRVKALVEENRTETPKAQKAANMSWLGVDSPSKFLDPNVSFHANFDLSEAMAALQSPAAPMTPRGTKKSRKESLSLEEVFTHHLDLAVKNTGRESTVKESTPYSQRVRSTKESQEEEMEEAGPLHGVVIAVSKKLSTQQSEYNNVAAGLGADYRWTFDRSCTHFIFTGRLNDTNKEFRMAKDQGKVIVSPHWLSMCQEQKCRVDESLFPHTFNPNLSLTFSQAVTPASTRRSTRATRLTRKSKKSTDSSSTSDAEGPKIKASKIAMASKQMFDSLDTTASDEEIAQVCDNAEEEVKETNTQALVKDLKTLMAATKNYSSKSRRSSMKRNDSLGKMDENEGSAKRSRLSMSHSRTDSTDTPGKRERRGSRSARSTPKAEVQSDVSQMAEVSWDDPIARQHQQLLAHDLAKNSESLSPEADRRERYRQPASPLRDDDYNQRDADTTMDEITFKHPSRPVLGDVEDRVPTPEAPSLAFRLPRRTCSVSPPKPVEIAEDEHAEEGEEHVVEQPRLFLLSGMDQNERDDYGALVEGLGAMLSDAATYDPNCTHLVVGKPTRNEKYLASVAAGKWVLHKSYFEACRQEGRFVQEELHEWGSEATGGILQKAAPQIIKLAEAAHRWRCKLTNKRGIVGDCGAFDGWRVLLLTDAKRQQGFRRLLEAGGGQVLGTRPPFSSLDNVTHAFMDPSKRKLEVDLTEFVRAGIPCVKPEYIAAFLMEPNSEPQQYYIQEVLPLLESSKIDPRKRKASSSEAPGTPSKRSKT